MITIQIPEWLVYLFLVYMAVSVVDMGMQIYLKYLKWKIMKVEDQKWEKILRGR